MNAQKTRDTQCGCPRNAANWGKAVGYGIALGTVVGTVVGVAAKNYVLVYIGMGFGGAIGAMVKSKPTKSD